MFRLCSRPQYMILFCSLVLKDGGQSSEVDLRGGRGSCAPVWVCVLFHERVPLPFSCMAEQREPYFSGTTSKLNRGTAVNIKCLDVFCWHGDKVSSAARCRREIHLFGVCFSFYGGYLVIYAVEHKRTNLLRVAQLIGDAAAENAPPPHPECPRPLAPVHPQRECTNQRTGAAQAIKYTCFFLRALITFS